MTKTADELIKVATKMIEDRRKFDKKHDDCGTKEFKRYAIAVCALKTKKGNVYCALNVRTYQPSIGACGEMVAIGMAHTAEFDADIDTIVTMRGEATREYVISPCGRCREFIADYSTNANVVLPADNKKGYTIKKIHDLIPDKYVKKHDLCPCCR